MTASLPWMEEEDRREMLDEIQRRAAGPTAGGEERWGGGYRSGVKSVSTSEFRDEIRRGVNG